MMKQVWRPKGFEPGGKEHHDNKGVPNQVLIIDSEKKETKEIMKHNLNFKDVESFDQLVEVLKSKEKAIQILQKMIEFIRQNDKMSDMRKINDEFKGGRYRNTMAIVEGFYHRYLKRKNISQESTLLEEITSSMGLT